MTSVASTSASGGAWDDEAAFDKFATLFSPPTPRASPTSEAKNAMDARATAPPHRPPIAVSDSDFGSFVSVSANEDPLSFMSSSANVLPPPMQPSFAPLTPQPTRTPTMPASSKPNHTRANPSLDFFDAFGREAKEASERNKRQVLDELLLHEEDPLYFSSASSSNGSAPWQSSTSGQPITDAPSTMSPGVEVDEEFGELQSSAPASASAPSFDASLIDFDPVATPRKPPSLADLSESTIGHPHHQPHHHSHHHVGSPTRQSTLTPSTLAPPLTSSNSASSIPITPVNELPSEYPFPISSSPPRSQSYQTLSGLSSSWLSTIRDRGFSSILPSAHTRQATDPGRTPTHDAPHAPTHANTQPVTITHNTPFVATAASHSPFAPHVYVPPSGAPGFRGEAYDWDKGYSTELERDIQASANPSRDSRPPPGTASSTSSRAPAPTRKAAPKPPEPPGSLRPATVDDVMQKKLGGVVLTGRNANTEVILTNEIADSIRPYLPALARLPRSWSLLYSLDQHGISLATLYRKCEAALDTRRTSGSNTGALVVIKDSAGTVFGAWLGDGIRPSKGQGFYGGGESFLWKKTDGGKCRVFRWTGKNDYVTLCEPEYISFGGGDGQYGIWLDESLFDGSSARCPTFDNDPLCSPGAKKGRAVQFECVGLEVWGVGS